MRDAKFEAELDKGMTVDEAAEMSTKVLEYQKNLFCPMISGKCKPECVCFVPIKIDEDKTKPSGMSPVERSAQREKRYYVTGGVCSAYLLTGIPWDDQG